jgi:hypothetical protein
MVRERLTSTPEEAAGRLETARSTGHTAASCVHGCQDDYL